MKLLWTVLPLAACGGRHSPAAPAVAEAHAGSSTEIVHPIVHHNRVGSGVPAPEAEAAAKLPPGVRCRIGSDRFRTDGDVVFHGNNVMRLESTDWFELDPRTGDVVAKFEGGLVAGVSASGQYAVAGSSDEMRVVDIAAHKPIASIPVEQYYSLPDMRIADDASRLVSYSWDQRDTSEHRCISIFDRKLARVERCFGDEPGVQINVPALSRDGTRIAVFATDSYDVVGHQQHPSGKLHVLDAASAKTLATFPFRADWERVALSAHGDLVALADRERVRIIDAATGAERRSWPVSLEHPWRDLAFDPDGTRLFGLTDEEHGGQSLIAWDATTGKRVWEHTGLFDVLEFAISPDGQRVGYELGNGVRIADATSGDDLTPATLWGLESSALSEDGTLAATRSIGWVTLWNARTCAVTKAIPHESALGGYRGHLEFIAGTHDLLGSEGGDTFVRIRADGSITTAHIDHLSNNDSHAVTRDGKLLVFGIQDDNDHAQLAIWDLDAMREIKRVPWPKHKMIEAMTFTPDQHTLITASPGYSDGGDLVGGSRSVSEFDVATWKPRASYTVPVDGQHVDLAVFGGGDLLAVNDVVMRRSTRKLETKLEGEPNYPSPDGRSVVLMRDRDLAVWRLDEPKPGAWGPWLGVIVSAALDGTTLQCQEHGPCDVVPPPR